MSNDLWKQAAAQESVDYEAVESSFMTQAYGYVANKAKVLFRDPFRLGFEIVHRNEKATKMVGIFAFRCNQALLYAPVFFVNGEVKGADMLYRGDVKRFVPLTEKWCSFLVRGANEESGRLVDRGRRRQADAYMDRLAYPQRIKYASLLAEEADAIKQIGLEMFKHCSQNEDIPLLLPKMIDDVGPDSLEKLASLIEGSATASRFLAENYSEADLSGAGWLSKQAAAPVNRFENCVVLVTDISLAKTAASRKDVADHGYALEDYRELGAVKSVVEYIDDSALYDLAGPGEADVMLAGGETKPMVLMILQEDWLESSCAPRSVGSLGSRYKPETRKVLVSLSDGQCIPRIYPGETAIIGTKSEGSEKFKDKLKSPSSAATGKVYVIVKKETLECSQPFAVREKDGKCLTIVDHYGYKMTNLCYVEGEDAAAPERGFFNDEYGIFELEADVKIASEDEHNAQKGEVKGFDTKWTHPLMTNGQLDQWLRTGGETTTSGDITVTKEKDGLFAIRGEGFDGPTKVARSLTRMGAHLRLAGDYEMRVGEAGQLLDFVEDKDKVTVRLHSDREKKAYVTRMEPEEQWQTGYDPVINARLDAPQQQRLGTHTPQRMQQHIRYGDTYDNGEARNQKNWDGDDSLPEDDVMGAQPEQLAEMAKRYGMPHVFDHAVVGRMANSIYDTIEQVKQYIPDLETGVDRHARILFLLRYRPADFEEAYGKDELMEMEQELTSVFNLAGESLLRLLKRFDADKFRPSVDG